MQIPVFIVEQIEIEGEDGPEIQSAQRDLILLHWGTKEAYYPVLPEEKVYIPMAVTVGICRDPITGETLMVNPSLIYFKPDNRIML